MIPWSVLPPRRRRAKTSSERGRAYRERQKKYHAQLERDVAALRARVAELQVEQDRVRAGYTPDTASTRPLARTNHGLVTSKRLRPNTCQPRASEVESFGRQRMTTKEEFLKSIVEKDGLVRDLSRRAVGAEHWWTSALAHDQVRGIEVVSVTAYGTEDRPIVEVLTKMTGTISHDTLRVLFPGVSARVDLQQRFLGKQVTYSCRHFCAFSADNQVAVERAEIDFIQGLHDAGCRLGDIAELMDLCAATPLGMAPSPIVAASKSLSAPVEPRDTRPSKLCVEFLLAE